MTEAVFDNVMFKFSCLRDNLFLTVFGVVGKNGKVYFSGMDSALVLGRTRDWVCENASCRLREILPDCTEPDEWMFEREALLSKLREYMNTGYRAEREVKLYDLLQYDKFQLGHCGKRNVYKLDESEDGFTLAEWIVKFREAAGKRIK